MENVEEISKSDSGLKKGGRKGEQERNLRNEDQETEMSIV